MSTNKDKPEKNISAYSYNSDFWSEKRVKKNMTLKQIARLLGVSRSAVGNYFSGRTIPDDSFTTRLCELLDADHDKGVLEFQRLNRAYYSGVRQGKSRGVSFTNKKVYVKKGDRPVKPGRIDNFWTRKKEESKFSYKEIGSLLDINTNTVWAYLSGYLIPPEDKMGDICDLFGVSITKGKQEFALAHNQYVEQHSSKFYQQPTRSKNVDEPVTKVPEVVEEETKPVDVVVEVNKPKTDFTREYIIVSSLYEKISSYKEFISLLGIIENNPENILEAAYRKVDFDTYLELVNIIRDFDSDNDAMVHDSLINLLKR